MAAIDAHVHVWTPETERYPLAGGFRRANMDPPSFTVEQLQTEMKANDVGRVVLIQMSFYGYDNSYMLDCIAAAPQQFSGVAVIEQDAGDPAPTMKILKSRGVRGFRIAPKDRPIDKWLSTDTMTKMWVVGAQERLAMCCLMDPDGLPALDRMCRQFPETPVVIDHMCRIGVTGTISPTDVKALCAMARHPQVTVKVSAFYALGKKAAPYTDLEPLIRQVYDAYGPQRLMWASDSPFQVVGGHTYGASIKLVREGLSFLSAADREWLLSKTAEKVYFG